MTLHSYKPRGVLDVSRAASAPGNFHESPRRASDGRTGSASRSPDRTRKTLAPRCFVAHATGIVQHYIRGLKPPG